MDIIPGKKKDSSLFLYKGFKYLEDKLCKKVARCSSRKLGCKATVHFVEDISDIDDFKTLKEDVDFFIKKEHTDLPDENGNVWSKMKEVMKEQAQISNEQLINIFNEVSQV